MGLNKKSERGFRVRSLRTAHGREIDDALAMTPRERRAMASAETSDSLDIVIIDDERDGRLLAKDDSDKGITKDDRIVADKASKPRGRVKRRPLVRSKR